MRLPPGILIAVTLASTSAALAQAPTPAAEVKDDAKDKKDGDKKGKKDTKGPEPEWTLDLGGRLFVRDTLNHVEVGDDDVVSHARALDLARLFATYDRKRLRVAFEIDFADGDADVKDTYIRIQANPCFRVQAGRFKAPISYVGLTSRWNLPATERGILSELEVQERDLPFGGTRGDGVLVEYRPRIALDPRLSFAALQNPLATAETPIDPRDDLTQDLYARAAFEPLPGLELASTFAWIGYQEEVGEPDSYAGFPLGSLELQLETRFLRAWAEAFAGESFVPQPDGGVAGRFTAARILVAGRIAPPSGPLREIEPFVIASTFDPTDDVGNDRMSEVGGGLVFAFSKHWRLQLEVDRRIAGGGASPGADGTVARLQLGATFEEQIAAAPQEPP